VPTSKAHFDILSVDMMLVLYVKQINAQLLSVLFKKSE